MPMLTRRSSFEQRELKSRKPGIIIPSLGVPNLAINFSISATLRGKIVGVALYHNVDSLETRDREIKHRGAESAVEDYPWQRFPDFLK